MACHRNALLKLSLNYFFLTALSWKGSVIMIFFQEKNQIQKNILRNIKRLRETEVGCVNIFGVMQEY